MNHGKQYSLSRHRESATPPTGPKIRPPRRNKRKGLAERDEEVPGKEEACGRAAKVKSACSVAQAGDGLHSRRGWSRASKPMVPAAALDSPVRLSGWLDAAASCGLRPVPVMRDQTEGSTNPKYLSVVRERAELGRLRRGGGADDRHRVHRHHGRHRLHQGRHSRSDGATACWRPPPESATPPRSRQPLTESPCVHLCQGRLRGAGPVHPGRRR